MSFHTSYSTVVYPSTIFSLNKPETLLYERFAYEALRLAHEVLNDAKLPDALFVTFEPDAAEGDQPWTLNAYVSPRYDCNNMLAGFTVGTTPFTPPVLLAICHTIGVPLFAPDTYKEWYSTPAKLRSALEALGQSLTASIRICQVDGLGHALNMFMTSTGYNISNVKSSAMLYNCMASFLVNHEVAHAYVGQLTHDKRDLSKEECRAFEFIVDLVATTWLYNRIVRNTPDSSEYRQSAGYATHSHSIQENARIVLNTQFLILLFFAFAVAMENGGLASLEGGQFHPHSLLRHIMQMVHFSTLVLSNQKTHFRDDYETFLDDTWHSNLNLLCQAGVVTQTDLEAISDDTHYADLRKSAELIEEFKVAELDALKPYLELMAAPPEREVGQRRGRLRFL